MYIFDTFTNFLSGLGVQGRDKLTASQYTATIWTRDQLEASFRSDWIARKAIQIPASDSVREWRAWQAEQDQIEKLEETEQRLQVQLKLQQALVKARLYGGCCIMIGVDGDMASELVPDTIAVDGLKFLHVLAPHQLTVDELDKDISSPYYGQPLFYTLVDETNKFGSVKIHPSRMVRLIGLDHPDPFTNNGWGDPVLQMIHDAVNNAGTVAGSIATLIAEAKLDVIKIPGLTEIFSTNAGTNKMLKRFSEANVAKSVINAIVMDAQEEWQRIGVTFAGMPEIMQMYLQIAAGAADIPMTRFAGMSPGGLNATGDSDLQNYYDRIAADQQLRLTPALDKLDRAIVQSALGTTDENIFYEWNSLWQMDEGQKSEIAKRKAEQAKIDVDSGLIPFEALVLGRCNQLIEDGTYPGLEAGIEEAIAAEEMPTEPPPPKLLAPPGAEGMEGQEEEELEPEVAEDSDRPFAAKDARLVPWDESKHSRGQPGNKGQFGPGGGGASTTPSESSTASHVKPKPSAASVLARAREKPKGMPKSEGAALVARARTSGRSVAEQHEHEVAKTMRPPKAAPDNQQVAALMARQRGSGELSPAAQAALARQRAPGSYEPPPPAPAAEPAPAPKAEGKGKAGASRRQDFAAAGISLNASYNAEEEDVINDWNEHVKMDPADFKLKFMGGQTGSMVITGDPEQDTFRISGKIEGTGHLAGDTVAHFSREINFKKKEAYSALFEVEKEAQKAGIGKKLLAGNIEVYEALGIEKVKVTAGLDVGGYAWAKYGYVPTNASWEDLKGEIADRLEGGRGGGYAGNRTAYSEPADEWGMLSSDQQTAVYDRWKEDGASEFYENEVDNWRESGRALEDAKQELASSSTRLWAKEAIERVREERKVREEPDIPYSDEDLMAALVVEEYSSRYDDGRDDPDISFDDKKLMFPKGRETDQGQGTLPGIEPPDYSKRLTEDMRKQLTEDITSEFNKVSERNADDVDPPDYLAEQASDYQAEYWDQIEDEERLRIAERYDMHNVEYETEEEEEEREPLTEEERDPIRDLLRSSNPKSLWKIADSPRGKELLLKQGWAGVLNLKDPESYARFKEYVARPPKKEA